MNAAEVATGHLTGSVPASGEDFHLLARLGPAGAESVVEHIVSSASADPTEQVQDHPEWVVVVAGSARLEIAGQVLALEAGDWVTIPPGVAHRVLDTATGTHWIAVHGPPAG